MSKKLVSLLMALMMALTLSLGAAAEEPAAYQPQNFSEHFVMFANTLDLMQKDVQAVLSAPGGMYSALISGTEKGLVGRLYSAEGELAGAGEFDDKAVYMSDGKMTYGITFESIKKFAEKMASKIMPSSGEGVSSEQMQQDVETVMGWAEELVGAVQGAYSKVTVSENEYIVTVDAPAFAQGFTGWADKVLGSEEFAAIWGRYSGALSGAPSAEEIAAAWAAQKEQVAALISQAEASITVRNEEGVSHVSLNAVIPFGTDKLNVVLTAVRTEDEENMTTAIQIDGAAALASAGETKLGTLVATVSQGLGGQTVHADLNVNGQQIVYDHAYSMNLFGGEITVSQSTVVDGEAVTKVNGTLNLFRQTFDITADVGPWNAHCAFDGVKFVMNAAQGGEQVFALEAWGEETDASNYVVHVVADYQGQTMPIDLRASFVPMDPETAAQPEVLQLGVYMGENPMAMLQLGTAEKTGEPALSAGEVTWLDENMLEMMFGGMLGGFVGQPQVQAPVVVQ